MIKQDKREPTFNDLSLMPFGKYKDKPLQDIPATYFRWLRDILEKEGFNINPKPDIFKIQAKWQQDKYKLYNYIWNCQDAFQMELGEKE